MNRQARRAQQRKEAKATAEQRAALAKGRRLALEASRAAMADPENHEKRAIAFALATTVKVMEQAL